MISNDNICLRSNGFDNIVKSCWKELQMEQDLCDITLACEDKQIETRKFLISSFSPILRNILKLNKNPHPVIYLRRVKYKDLQNLINFMYQGEVDVAEKDVSSFLEVDNTESIRERGPKYNGEDIAPSVKRERMVDIKQTTNIMENPKQTTSVIGNVKQTTNVIENLEQTTNIIQNPELTTNVIENHSVELLAEFESSINYDGSKYLLQQQEIMSHDFNEDTNLSTISKITNKQFVCQKCDKSFSKSSNLSTHNKAIHKGVKYPCTDCNYKATLKANLKEHVAAIHEGVKYPCTECNYKATSKRHLQQHVEAVHENIKYYCTECDYKSAWKQQLNSSEEQP